MKLTIMPIRLVSVALLAVLLSACGGNMDDLERWVEQVKARPAGEIEPLPEVEPYETFEYSAHDLRSPFTPGRAEQPESSGEGPRPDPDRPREPLEGFSLDSLDMVGTFELGGEQWGLVRDPDGLIHRVQPGNYMGRNYGHIVEVNESRIRLVELVPDGSGGWMERDASLTLDEPTRGG